MRSPSRNKRSLTAAVLGLVFFLFVFTIHKSNLGKYEGRKLEENERVGGHGTPSSKGPGTTTSGLVQVLKLRQENNTHPYHPIERTLEENIKSVGFKDSYVEENNTEGVLKEMDIATRSQAFSSQHSEQENGERRKRFPTAIILGVKKAGTRALLEILRIHPNVIGTPGEVYFFNGFHQRGLEWYRQQMPVSSPGQMTIEKSPTYFTSVERTQIAKRMFLFSRSIPEDVKLLVVVRDPTIRAISDYTDFIARNRDKNPIEEFEDLVLTETGRINPESEIIKNGLYIEHLIRWLEYFPSEEIHFVSGEELVRRPLKEVRDVENFLNLKPFYTERHFRFNKAKGFPCFVQDPSDNSKVYCLPPNKGRKHFQVEEKIRKLLKEFYRPFNLRLYSAVNRTFDWQ